MTEPRRQFRLPEADEDFMARLGHRWESIVDTGLRWLIIRDFPLPRGFNRTMVDVAINIAPGYPPGPLDMAYFYPWLSRKDGHPILSANVARPIDGLSWQQWSRHRTAENRWVEGEDDLASHIHYMEGWLAKEPERA